MFNAIDNLLRTTIMNYLKKEYGYIEAPNIEIDESIINYNNYYVIRDNCAVVLLKDRIVIVDMGAKCVIREVGLGNYGDGEYYEIYDFNGDYILYGERYILRLTNDFERIWNFSGRDIFISPDYYKTFEITEKEIIVIDYPGWIYHLDFSGKLIFEENPRCKAFVS